MPVLAGSVKPTHVIETEVMPVHDSVDMVDHVGNPTEACVIANLADHPYLRLGAHGLAASVHMRPADAIALGRLLIKAGEASSWVPVNPALLEAC
jgi:hypothetical protein